MKPAPFAYESPRTLESALSLLGEHGDEAKVLAGGQSLIPVMNFRLARPAVLVDLNRLTDLDFVERNDNGTIRIGALTRQSRAEHESMVAEHAPLLAEALPHVAHPQIRNRGTLGGTIAHADPAAEIPAVAVTLGARFRLLSARGERWVAAGDFFTGLFATTMAPDELLVEIEIPIPAPRTGSAFLEVARRHGDYALAGVAVTVTLDESGACTSSNLAVLGVGDRPALSSAAAGVLDGERPSEALVESAAAAIRDEIEPLGDIHASAEFKCHLSGVLARRALALAFERTGKEGTIG